MINTYVFKAQDFIVDGETDSLAEFEFSVKTEFLEKVPHPEELFPHILFLEHSMQNFLHSTNGPAAKLLVVAANKEKGRPRMDSRQVAKEGGIPGYESGQAHFGEYWINGKRVSPEEEAVMLKNFIFSLTSNNVLDELFGDPNAETSPVSIDKDELTVVVSNKKGC
jgi:hypothetical protein